MGTEVGGVVVDGVWSEGEYDRVPVAAVGQVDIAVLVVDDERRVVIVNQALRDLVHGDYVGTPGSRAGSGTRELVGAARADWGALPGLVVFAEAMDTVGSVRDRLPDGRARHGTWHAVPSGLMLTVYEVTADAPARKGSRQQELVSAVLHELRTPLTTLASTIEYLPEPDEQTAPVYELIRRTTDRMRGVLAELASVADLESGGAKLDQTRVDLGRIVTETVTAWRARDDLEMSVVSEISVVPEVSGTTLVDGDAHWLRVMVDRLVAVAVTAASPGLPVTVTATGTPDGWTLRLPVDSGLGSDRLYTRTGEKSNATALMLARAVLARHGGGLTTSSRDGRVELCATVPARASSGGKSMTTERESQKA